MTEHQSDSVPREQYDAALHLADRAIEQCHELKRQRDFAMSLTDKAIEVALAAAEVAEQAIESMGA